MITSTESPYTTAPIRTFLLAAGLALQAFGAVYKPEALGFLAASPGVPLLLMAALMSAPFMGQARVSLLGWVLIAWGLLGSSVSLMYFGWDALYASKVIPLLILSIVWLSPLLCYQALSVRALQIGMAVGLVICLVGYITSDLLPGILPDAIQGVIFGGDYTVYYDDRPRAFMAEPSHFGAIVGRYFLLLFLLWEIGRPLNRGRLMLFLIALAAVVLIIGSKGAAIAIAITLMLMVLNRRAFGFALVLVPVAWWLITSQIDAFAIDLDRFTSTATRTGLGLAGAAAVLVNPIGWGYYGFYGTVVMFGAWAMDKLFGLPFRFTELEMIVGDLNSVSYKTTLLDFGVVFGWPFFLFLGWVLKSLDLGDLRVRCGVAFLLIVSISTAGHESISFFLGIALLLKFYPRRDAVSTPPKLLVPADSHGLVASQR